MFFDDYYFITKHWMMKNMSSRVVKTIFVIFILSLCSVTGKSAITKRSMFFYVDNIKKNISYIEINNIRYVPIEQLLQIVNKDIKFDKNNNCLKTENERLKIYSACSNFYIAFIKQDLDCILQLTLPTICEQKEVYVPINSFIQGLAAKLDINYDLLDNSIFIETNEKYLIFFELNQELANKQIANQTIKKDTIQKDINNSIKTSFILTDTLPKLSQVPLNQELPLKNINMKMDNELDKLDIGIKKNIFKEKQYIQKPKFQIAPMQAKVLQDTLNDITRDQPNRRYSIPDYLIKRKLEELTEEK